MEKKTIELNPQPLPPATEAIVEALTNLHLPLQWDPPVPDWYQTLDLEGLVDKQQELAIKVIRIDNIIANLETQVQVLKNSMKAAESVREMLKAKLELNKE